MKKISLSLFSKIFLAFVVGVFFAPTFAIGQTQSTGEKINGFYESAHINADASVDIKEKIVYSFGSNQKHGIFRDIPVSYATSLGNQSITVSDISVTDEQGSPYTFTTSSKGKDIEIKVGDPNYTVTGIKTYIIGYKAQITLGYFTDYDEWYWNVTGNEWQVPIGESELMVFLPKPIEAKDLRLACYQGVLGTTGTSSQCVTNSIEDNNAIQSITFTSKAVLNPGEGLTVAVGFPKGIVYQPTAQENLWNMLKDNGILFLPILVFCIMFWLWFTRGKDPKGRGTIVPEYDAPDSISPMEMSMIIHQSLKNKDISAHIIYLATKGFIRITKTEEKGLIFTSTDYTLTKTKNISEASDPVDNALMTALYFDDTGDEAANTLILSRMKNNFYTKIPALKKAVVRSVVAKGYYPEDPQKTKGKYIGFGILFFVAIWLLGFVNLVNGIAIFSLILSGIIVMLFGFIMPKVTEAGAIIRERIAGLKMYISVAEKDRINFHNAPAKNPELFEKLLAFAMVLGVETAWANQFEGMYTTPPSWYNDPSGRMFSAVLFTHNLSVFSNTAASTLSTAPGSSSGSGGGGFSGGGGGGGGGGSW